MKKVIGLDFGTSSTQVSYQDAGGRARLLGFGPARNQRDVPTIIEIRDNEVLSLGLEAQAHFESGESSDGTTYIRSIKSAIPECASRGDGLEEFEISLIRKFMAYLGQLIADTDLTMDPRSPDVETQMSCPTVWGNQERNLLIGAARAAGFTVRDGELIDEPISAAVAWLQTTSGKEARGTSLIFDMGAGTLDLAVCRSDGRGSSRVIGAHGTRVAGDAVDEQILQVLESRISDALGVDYYWKQNPAAFGHIMQSIRDAKENLSAPGVFDWQFFIYDQMRPGWSSLITLTREDVRVAMNAPVRREKSILAMSQDAIEYVLRLSKMTDNQASSLTPAEIRSIPFKALRSEISNVILVGGMTLMPAVSDFLTNLFPQAQVRYASDNPSYNPRETVSLGLVQIQDPVSLSAFRPNFSIQLSWQGQERTIHIYEAYSPIFSLSEEATLNNRKFTRVWYADEVPALDSLPTSPSDFKGAVLSFVKPSGTPINVKLQSGEIRDGFFFAFGPKCHRDLTRAEIARVILGSDGSLTMIDGQGSNLTLRLDEWSVTRTESAFQLSMSSDGYVDDVPEELHDWWIENRSASSPEHREDSEFQPEEQLIAASDLVPESIVIEFEAKESTPPPFEEPDSLEGHTPKQELNQSPKASRGKAFDLVTFWKRKS